MDDWQDAAFSTRHLHNRNDRGGQNGKRAEFDARNTFGSHLVKCPAIDRLSAGAPRKASKSRDVVLEIYRLTDEEDGLLGSLKCPGSLDATVVFAGSRKRLWKIMRTLGDTRLQLEGSEMSPKRSARGRRQGDDEDGAFEEDDGGEEEEDEESDSIESFSTKGLDPEARHRRRISAFEKNSFRQPKFWFRWQGEVQDSPDSTATKAHGSGYIVFSGNDCRRFQGTVTSEDLSWNNVKMTGWKTRPQPERDFEIRWKPS